jgi:hypothetical protein
MMAPDCFFAVDLFKYCSDTGGESQGQKTE